MLRAYPFLLLSAALAVPAAASDAGETLFRKYQCASCHSVRGVGGKSAPALGPKAGESFTPNAMAAAMWTHAAVMWKAMDQARVGHPPLSARQAGDLYAYVAGTPAQDKPGDARRGRQVFEAKLCSSCHDQPYLGAPGLSPMAGRTTAFAMMSSLWQHGGGMLSRMVAKNVGWQRIGAAEMADLVAYLNAKK